MDARVCFGEGEQEKIDIVENQTPPGLGLALVRIGTCVRILMRDSLVSFSMDNVVSFTLLKS